MCGQNICTSNPLRCSSTGADFLFCSMVCCRVFGNSGDKIRTVNNFSLLPTFIAMNLGKLRMDFTKQLF